MDSSVLERWRDFYEQHGFIGHKVIFVLGPMGAGKSTFIKNTLLLKKDYLKYLYVDTDEIMASLEGFDIQDIQKYYLLAREMSFSLTNWMLARGYSFITEGTCVQWRVLWDYMLRLNQKNYDISAVMLSESQDTVVERASSRSRKLDPSHVIRIYHDSLAGCQQLLAENTKTKIFTVIDKETLTHE